MNSLEPALASDLYWLANFLGGSAALLVFWGRCKTSADSRAFRFFTLAGPLSFLIGTRLLGTLIYFVDHSDATLAQSFAIGGSAFYGGLIVFLLAVCIYGKSKVFILRLFDLTGPGIILGIVLGRVGCLFTGCCYGKVSRISFGGTSFIFRHPTQIYDAILNLVLFTFLIRISKNEKRPGFVGAAAIGGYAILRFFTEFARGDSRGFVFPYMSYAQMLSLLFIGTIGLGILRKPVSADEPEEGQSSRNSYSVSSNT